MIARLYKAAWLDGHDVEVYDEHDQLLPLPEPEGWREYALSMWGSTPPEHEHWPNGHKPFFFPSTDRIYRSRSAAQRRVDLINAWGGSAVLVECEPTWVPTELANKQRAAARLEQRIERKQAELADLQAQRESSVLAPVVSA